MTTPYHARYFAHELTRQAPAEGVDRLSMALFDACVDLNPHQIEAALFALRSPISKGVIMADEVGLGKTIEAGIVMCQSWAEQRRRLLVICPASLRKQWAAELEEKFNLPCFILDSRSYRQAQKEGNPRPFEANRIVITSLNYASRMKGEIRFIGWDLVVIDEAHKLRNAYRPSNKMGQNIRWATEEHKKLLLTATPLQNSLLELYGLSSIIDERIFGDVASFRYQYTTSGGDLPGLKDRLSHFCKRTLRKHVNEYIRYTERRPITQSFSPTDDEHRLYQAVSVFLAREDTFSIPQRQRHLTTLIIYKQLASSSQALAGTLNTLKERLEGIRDGLDADDDLPIKLIDDAELESDLLDEILDGGQSNGESEAESEGKSKPTKEQIQVEIDEISCYIAWANGIGLDTKTRSLLKALEIGFEEMEKMGAARKAIIFTESRRTQEYLRNFLEANGHAGQVATFNGTNSDPNSRQIYEAWVEKNRDTGRATGSRTVNIRTAIIEHFRDEASIMIATEAAAEGLNLQFCSMVINYDLPWNPQRIEQRIGRCHRYGQLHDVVVINFLNTRNQADIRVHELLTQKFHLFSGIFGASDDVLGAIESGVDFEKRVLAIHQKCRTSAEIDAAFARLQEEMEDKISEKMDQTRQMLMEFFDEDVHARLRVQLTHTREQLDRVGRMFWTLSKFMLDGHARFDDQQLAFHLHAPPISEARPGHYHLISKSKENVTGEFLYRLSHPLGTHVLDTGKEVPAPLAEVTFDVSNNATHIAVVEALCGKGGWLTLQHLTVDSFDREEYLLFSAIDDEDRTIDQETCEKLFNCRGQVGTVEAMPTEMEARLKIEARRHVDATISRSLESNSQHFNEERERLDKWADDMVIAAEKELADTKVQIKALNRQARQATTTDEQHEIQTKIQWLQKKQRRQRQNIFDVEDEIEQKRDALIGGLEKRMSQETNIRPLFSIRWNVA